MREVQGDAILRRRDDLPDAILVSRIGLRERRARDGAITVVEESTASICQYCISILCSKASPK